MRLRGWKEMDERYEVRVSLGNEIEGWEEMDERYEVRVSLG